MTTSPRHALQGAAVTAGPKPSGRAGEAGPPARVNGHGRRVPFVDLHAEYQAVKPEVDAAIARVLDGTDFILGEAVGAFEADFARYCGVAHAVGVDSGFSALELSLRAAGVGSGHEVITAANTFYSTVAAITSCGARPVLVDADPDTATLDPARLEAALTADTRAVVPVHLYGHPADMAPIVELAGEHGLRVIDDACQAHGARYRGRAIGGSGDAAAFSLYPSKNLGAFGDGGIVVTDDEELAERLRLLRNLGMRRRNQHEMRGYNRRLDTIQAAVVRAKLPRLDAANTHRRWVADQYAEHLESLPVELPRTASWAEHVFHLYVIQCDERERLIDHLAEDGIETGIHYPVPIHLQPPYADLGYRPGDFPVAEAMAPRILSLPMHPFLGAADVARVTARVASFFT